MKNRELEKIFKDNIIQSSIKNFNKKIGKYIIFFQDIFFTEVFDKLYKNFNNSSPFNINEFREEFEEINNLFKRRCIEKGCRKFKGIMEDCLSFIALNFSNNSISTNTNTRAGYVRNFVEENADKIFTIFNSEVNNKTLDVLYNYVAKIDHTTSLKFYIKDVQNSTHFKKIELNFLAITYFLIMLLVDYIYSLNPDKNEENINFTCKIYIVLQILILASFAYNFNSKDNLIMPISNYFKEKCDLEYLESISNWFRNSLEINSIKSEQEAINQFMKNLEKEIIDRGYSILIS